MNTQTARGSFAAGPMGDQVQAGDEFDIQWMPPGRQHIVCIVEDEPREMEFDVTPRHAQAMNAYLQRLRSQAAAGQGDEPFFDFDHEDGRASGHPTELYWAGDDPKKGGIRARGKWTGSGKAALAARDFTRFSPKWDFNADTDEPIGVTANLGGLVNRAAFTRIEALAKRPGNNESIGENTMTKEEFKALLDEGLKPINERIGALEASGTSLRGEDAATARQAATAAAPTEDKILLLVQTALKPVTEKLTEIDKQAGENRVATAKARVGDHIRRGAIAPEDAETIQIWTDAVLKDADKAEKAMAKLPGRRFTALAANASAATGTSAGVDRDIVEGARAIAKAAPDRFKSDADAIEAFAHTARGNEAYLAYRDSLVTGRAGLPTMNIIK